MLFLEAIASPKVRCVVFVEMLLEHEFMAAVLALVLGLGDLLNIR